MRFVSAWVLLSRAEKSLNPLPSTLILASILDIFVAMSTESRNSFKIGITNLQKTL